MDFAELRKEYETSGIAPNLLLDDPIAQFRNWFEAASNSCPDKLFEPNAMTLATSDGQGDVTARVLLLKGIEPDGILFFTNYNSTKGQQLAANPRASVVLHWPWQGRQVRLAGTVERTSPEVSRTYFHSRPRGAQLGAVVSQQSSTIDSREQLDLARTNLDKELAGDVVPLPDDWGGYCLRPDRVEFWQGRVDRLHDRFVYRLSESENWSRTRVAP